MPALQFRDVFGSKSSIWSLRFSKTNRGSLGALSSTGHLKNFDIAKDFLSEEYRASIDETLGQDSFKNYPEPVYTKYVRDIRSPFNHPNRGSKEKDRVVAFDFLNLGISSQPSAIAIDGNKIPQIITGRPPCPPVALSSQGVLACGISSENSDVKFTYPLSEQESPVSDVVGDIRSRALRAPSSSEVNNEAKSSELRNGSFYPIPSRVFRESALAVGTDGALLTAKEALALSDLNRRRCKEGYLFDEARNQKIVADDAALQDFWSWAERELSFYEVKFNLSNATIGARLDSSGTTMVVNGFDMNYLGVSNVWLNDFG